MPDISRELRDAVWNSNVVRNESSSNANLHNQLILEQYKLCVEMADRISARRGLTNSFFLTLNLAAVSILVSVASKMTSESGIFIPAIALIILCGQCLVWFCALRSYRLINKAKYAVIEIIEEKLPARAYSKGEWHAFVRSGRYGNYLRLSTAEQIMPALFTVGYIAIFAYFASI